MEWWNNPKLACEAWHGGPVTEEKMAHGIFSASRPMPASSKFHTPLPSPDTVSFAMLLRLVQGLIIIG